MGREGEGGKGQGERGGVGGRWIPVSHFYSASRKERSPAPKEGLYVVFPQNMGL